MTLLPLDEREAAEDARQALVEEQRMRRYQLEHNKKALGMLASRFERFDASVTREQRGPDALSQDTAYSVVTHRGGRKGSLARAHGLTENIREYKGEYKEEYSRFFPSMNEGKPTSRPELGKLSLN